MASHYRRMVQAAQMPALVSVTSAAFVSVTPVAFVSLTPATFVSVTPADAGAHLGGRLRKHAGWMPVYAGMTVGKHCHSCSNNEQTDCRRLAALFVEQQ